MYAKKRGVSFTQVRLVRGLLRQVRFETPQWMCELSGDHCTHLHAAPLEPRYKQVLPGQSEYGQSKFPDNSKSYRNHTLICHVLICPLNSKFAQFQRIFLGVTFSNSAGDTCIPANLQPERVLPCAVFRVCKGTGSQSVVVCVVNISGGESRQ